MPATLRLEDFGDDSGADAALVAAREAQERAAQEDRLAGFENGYKAGWDDAAEALTADKQAVSADLAGNLRDLAFTFHEARAHILKGAEPLLRAAVGKVIPNIAAHALPDLVAEQFDTLLRTATNAPLHLIVAPQSRSQVEEMLPADPGLPVEIREDPDLAEGQVFLRSGDAEVAVDTSAAMAAIQSALDDFFTLNERLEAHG